MSVFGLVESKFNDQKSGAEFGEWNQTFTTLAKV